MNQYRTLQTNTFGMESRKELRSQRKIMKPGLQAKEERASAAGGFHALPGPFPGLAGGLGKR